MQNTNNILLGSLFLLLVALSTWHMAGIAFPYLEPPFPTDIDFLASKQDAVQKQHWMIAFYVHITSSVIVLATGLTQFSKTLMFQYSSIHRLFGKVYVFLILLVAAPSGLVMAFHGNGGFSAQMAFVLQALFWWGLTYMAYQKIRKKDIVSHGKFMLRSYAMTLSAISLRGLTYIASYLKFEYEIYCPDPDFAWLCYPTFYILLAWLSWMLNLLIAEGLIAIGVMNYYTKKEPA